MSGACGSPAVEKSGTATPRAIASPRERIELAQGWRFRAGDDSTSAEPPEDDPGWQTVAVPHTWGPELRRNAWYRLRFDPGPVDPDQRAYLTFEGVSTRADVYVNGRHLGRHLGAYTGFTVDATPALAAGVNVVALRVSTDPQDTVDALPSGAGKQLYRTYGGIYRKAWLVKTRAAHFDPLDHGPRASTSRRRT